MASALLAAYGTQKIRLAYRRWQETISEIDNEWENLNYKFDGYGHWDYQDDLSRLDTDLVPAHNDTRQALVDAVAEELNKA